MSEWNVMAGQEKKTKKTPQIRPEKFHLKSDRTLSLWYISAKIREKQPAYPPSNAPSRSEKILGLKNVS